MIRAAYSALARMDTIGRAFTLRVPLPAPVTEVRAIVVPGHIPGDHWLEVTAILPLEKNIAPQYNVSTQGHQDACKPPGTRGAEGSSQSYCPLVEAESSQGRGSYPRNGS